MKILQLSSAQAFGGSERHLADLANTLATRGHDVYVALRPRSPLTSELRLPSQNVLTLPFRNALDARSGSGLAKLVKTKKIEVVHAHMVRDYALAAYAVRRNPTARLVVTRHLLFPISRLHKMTLAHSSRLIAVSNAVARQEQAQALISPDKITVIHNGIDVEKIEAACHRFNRDQFCDRWGLPAERALVGSVGTLTTLKGHEDFLHAAASLIKRVPSVFFVISAPESSATNAYKRRLENLIQKLGLSHSVRLLGWMDDISELYCALDVFVSASHSESFGLAIVEAMAAGSVVVATETEGAREIIEGNGSGVLIPIAATQIMADVIESLLNDPVRRKALVETARADVRERFTLERMVEETEQVYREALASFS